MSMGSMGASGGYLCPTGGWHESNGRCQVGSGVPIPLSRTCLIHHIPACRALAFNDSGNVTFAASLLSPLTKTAVCYFLFLYSSADGSIVKVAGDGPSGDVTPVGGTFTSGTLNLPITQITSDGDVIFLAQVTGGTS